MSDHHLSSVANRRESELVELLCRPPISESDVLVYVSAIESTLSHGLDLNSIDPSTGLTPLHAVACHIQSPSLARHVIQRLCAAGASIDRQDLQGRGVLRASISAGNTAVSTLLLEMGVTSLQSPNWEPFEEAVAAIRYPNPGVTLEQGIKVLTALKEAGERVSRNSHCLILASGGNDHGVEGDLDEVVQILLDAGADINVTEQGTGRQAIHYAAMRGSWKTVAVLLRSGADVLVRDLQGHVAFNYAEESGLLGHELRALIRAAEMKHLIAAQSTAGTLRSQVAA